MGAAESTLEVEEVLDEVQQSTEATEKLPPGVKAFSWNAQTDQWQRVSSHARPRFYNVNEDNENQPPLWHLEVEALEVDTPTDLELHFIANRKQLSVCFSADGRTHALRFPDFEGYDAFCEVLNSKQFENQYGVPDTAENKVKMLGPDFANTMYATPTSSSSADDSASEYMDADMEDISVPETVNEDNTLHKEGDPMKAIIIGALQNSYVLQGTQMHVVRNTPGKLENNDVSINITPIKGTSFTPSKVVMAGAERYMNMITPTKPTSLFRTDIEYGKVVSEWNFAKDDVEVPIKDISSDYKAAQLDETSTFLGLDNNRLCRWDLRTSEGVVDDGCTPVATYNGGKDYSRGTNFNCMATSGEGYVVVGSQDGKIRLYGNKSLTRAVTSFPGLGGEVTSVDVTNTGGWVLATTKTYLMLVRTIWKDRGGIEMNGFKKSIGKCAPKPVLLKLQPQDHEKTGFKPLLKAKFTWSTDSTKPERLITASCGNYSVVWDFRAVKHAIESGVVGLAGLPACSDYKLLKKDKDVVESAFMHDNFCLNDKNPMVVLTEHDVFTVRGD